MVFVIKTIEPGKFQVELPNGKTFTGASCIVERDIRRSYPNAVIVYADRVARLA